MCMGITPWKVAERGFVIAQYLTLRARSLLVIDQVSQVYLSSLNTRIVERPRVSSCTTSISVCLSSPFCSIQHLAGTHSGWTVPLMPIRPLLGSNLSPDWPTSVSGSSLLLSGGMVSPDNGLYRAQRSVLTATSSPQGRESPIQPYKPTKEGLFLSVTFLTTQVFCYFCSVCWDRGKATYPMH